MRPLLHLLTSAKPRVKVLRPAWSSVVSREAGSVSLALRLKTLDRPPRDLGRPCLSFAVKFIKMLAQKGLRLYTGNSLVAPALNRRGDVRDLG